jgi:hypothetical protein
MNYTISGDFINIETIEGFDNVTDLNFGFIITRHVNSDITNKYWVEALACVKNNYPKNKIVIIDDNSNPTFLNETGVNMENCTVIKSEFKGRGELLPYYYFYRYKWFNKAVIIHDSVFILKYINFDNVKTVQFLWEFPNSSENIQKEKKYISKLNNSELLLEFYEKRELWKGCFGVMSVITYDFIALLETKYYLFTLLYYIRTREDRCCLERIFAVLCNIENKNLLKNSSIFNSIYSFIGWGYTYNQYIQDKKTNILANYPIIKVWTGR